MRMKRFSIPLLLVAMIFVAGCSKETNITKTDLISKAWKYKTFSAVAGALTIDVLSTLQPCELDDIYRFNSNKAYTIEEGATKCNSSDPQIKESGSWRFNAAETKLYLGTDSVDIIDLTSTSLHLRYTDAGPPATTIDIIYQPAQ